MAHADGEDAYHHYERVCQTLVNGGNIIHVCLRVTMIRHHYQKGGLFVILVVGGSQAQCYHWLMKAIAVTWHYHLPEYYVTREW